MEQKTNVLESVGQTFSLIRDMIQSKAGKDHPEWTWIYELLADHYAEVCAARRTGKPLAWVNFGAPPELFHAMGIVPVVVDVLTGTLASSQNAVGYVDTAETRIPDYICSNNKILLGAALAGDIPIPDILVHPAHPCDSNLATYPVIAAHFGFPYFCIDMPYFRSDRCIPFVAGELRKLVAMLEEVTNEKLDMDRLKRAMHYSNLAHEYMLKVNELRQAVPCPYSSLEAISEYGVVLSLAGTPQLADYFARRYHLTKERVARGEGHLTREQERHRLVWIYGAPTFDMSLLIWLEREHGAVSVANMNNNFVMKPVTDISDYDSILAGLAEKVILLPMTRECGGPWENWLEASLELLKGYRADAAVFAGHVACKSNWAVAKLVKDKLHDELGIPTLLLEMDLFDPRVTSSDILKSRFDDFFDLHFPK